MRPLLTETIGTNGPQTLLIGGATYNFPDDYVPLANELQSVNHIVNNPFQSELARPDGWEKELVDAFQQLCKERKITELVAHSRGCLQALMLRERMEFERITLLHTPVVACGMSSKTRLPADSEYRMMDGILAQTCMDMEIPAYERFIQAHHKAYGDPFRKLKSILNYDVIGIPLGEIHARIRNVESDVRTKYLIINGGKDPWYDGSLTDTNKTLVDLKDQGHFSQIRDTYRVGNIINDWRAGRTIDLNKTKPIIHDVTAEVSDDDYDLTGGFGTPVRKDSAPQQRAG